MLLPNHTKHQCGSVIVDRPALQAWLHAWATGESFPRPESPFPHAGKEVKPALALLGRPRAKLPAQTRP